MRYYSTERPIEPGSFPKPYGNKVLNIKNFDTKTEIPKIDRAAWGFIEYESPLSDQIADQYELTPFVRVYDESRFITDCTRLIKSLEGLNISANMTPRQIEQSIENSDIPDLFQDERTRSGFFMELLDDGGIQIQCPSSNSERFPHCEC